MRREKGNFFFGCDVEDDTFHLRHNADDASMGNSRIQCMLRVGKYLLEVRGARECMERERRERERQSDER